MGDGDGRGDRGGGGGEEVNYSSVKDFNRWISTGWLLRKNWLIEVWTFDIYENRLIMRKRKKPGNCLVGELLLESKPWTWIASWHLQLWRTSQLD